MKDEHKDFHKTHSITEFKSEVRALSHKGYGVVDHPDGRVFFAKGTWPGDKGTFGVSAEAKNYDYAAVVALEVLAPERVTVPCPHRGDTEKTCGGCPWMMVSYEAQVKAKEQRVTFLLDKNAIPVGHRFPLLASPDVFGYRNRAQFKTDGVQLGYVSEGTNDLAPIEDCMILNQEMRGLLQDIRKALPNQAWIPKDGFPWSYLDVDDHQSIADVKANYRRPFRQGNAKQNDNMKAWIMEALKDVPRDWPLVEAFCGSGNFTESLSAAGFTNILAAEVRGSAIQELKAKKLAGVRIMEIDMNGKGVWQQLAKQQAQAKILLVDPPREGIEKRKRMFESLSKVELLIYISCEPATWARDVKDFQQNGWKVKHVTPLDMFPHTPHVELLSVLVKSK